jgi:predicted glycosyltransferase involved in capsule biosynthesis
MRRVVCIAKNLPARVVPDVSTFDFLPCSFVRKRKKKKNCDITTYVLFLLFCEKDIEERGRMKNFFSPPPFF